MSARKAAKATRRPRGLGTTRTLKNGLVEARYHEDGKQVAAPFHFETVEDADDWLAERRTAVRRGTWQSPRVGAELLRVFGERELSMRTYTPRSREQAEWLWAKYLDPAFGDDSLSRITADDVEEWRTELLKVTGGPTVRLAYNLLKSLMAAAVDKEKIKRNPCRVKGASTPRSQRRKHVSKDECMRITEHLLPHLQPLGVLGWWSAARKGEVLGLQWRDVDLDTGELHICRQVVQVGSTLHETAPKWHSDRFVTIGGSGLVTLREHHEATVAKAKRKRRVLPVTDRVFTNSRGGVLTPRALDQAWRKAREAAELPHVVFHDLRRSSATAMLASGMSIHDLMLVLGHQNITTTQRYLLDDPMRRPARAAAFAAYVEGQQQGTGT
jgi:integrase